ncbi:MAG: hypothetical protein AAF533_27090 [Acidobacteriota bacterium]
MRLTSFVAGLVILGGIAISPARALESGSLAWDRDQFGGRPVAIHARGSGLTVVEGLDRYDGVRDVGWVDLAEDGTILREGRFGLGEASQAPDSVLLDDGDLVVTWWESMRRDDVPLGEIHVASFDAERELRWSWGYDSGLADWHPILIELPDGELLVAGQADRSLLLVRLSAADGSVLGARRYDASFVPVAGVLTSTREIVLCGTAGGRVGLLALKPELDVSWYRSYDSPDFYTVRDLTARAEGGVLMVGFAFEVMYGQLDGWAMAVDSSGHVEWQLLHGGEELDEFREVVQLADGSYVILGRAMTSAHTWLLALEPDGSRRWETLHVSEPWQTGQVLALFDDGRLAVGSRYQGFDERDDRPDPGLFVFDASGTLPESCGSRVPFTSLSAPIDLVLADRPAPEVPVTVTRMTHELLQRSTSSAVRSCSGVVAEPPTEVSPPGAATPLRVDDGSVVSWEDGALSSSTSFHLYRGALGELAAGGSASCLVSDLTSPSAVDEELPSPSGGWYYLVAGVNEGGEGPVGTDSRGEARTVPAGCP